MSTEIPVTLETTATGRPPAASEPAWKISERAFCIGTFVVCVAVNLFLSAIGWDNSLREVHDSRQIQTALSVVHLQRDGWQLAYPLPLFGPPWSAPYEFPLYQYTAAKIGALAGISIESACRATSLLYLYLALPALFLVQRFTRLPAERHWLLPAAMLLTPVYTYYSRASMIESTALCCSSWFLYLFCRALHGKRWPVVLGAGAVGALAAAVKFPTCAIFLVPAAAFTLQQAREFNRRDERKEMRRTLALAVALAAVALAGGFWWTRFGDSVKSMNPLAERLTSTAINVFNFGTWEQRFDREAWRRVIQHGAVTVLPAANAFLAVLAGLVFSKRRLLWFTLALAFVSGPLVFMNLYVVHEYYFYACGAMGVAALVVAWSNVLDASALPRSARYAVVVLSLGIQVASYLTSYGRVQRTPPEGPPEIAQLVHAATLPEDVVLVYGNDWNPTIAYYSDRRAIMIAGYMVDNLAAQNEVFGRLGNDKIGAVVLTGELRKYPAFVAGLAERFDLHPLPILVSSDTQLFLRRDRLPHALAQLEPMALHEFSIGEANAGMTGLSRRRIRAEDVANPRVFSMFSPVPREIVIPFDLGVSEVQSRPAFNAHAPTDVIFTIPAGARRVDIGFGVVDAAAVVEQKTDGVEFRIELTDSAGRRRMLFSRFLDPVSQQRDRGMQHASLDLPPDVGGELNFRTLVGPNHVMISDWSYWSEIRIE